jgi:small redox-active disulfide protein 2
MKTVTVYGPGCRRCIETERLVTTALQDLGTEADVRKVTDYAAIAQAGVLATPALAVDGVLKVSGRIPSLDEVKGWIGR